MKTRDNQLFYTISHKISLQDTSQNDVILNKRSRIETANNNDISYEHSETLPEEEPVVTIEETKTLEENQLASAKGNSRLDSDSIEKVMINDGFLIAVLNYCCY